MAKSRQVLFENSLQLYEFESDGSEKGRLIDVELWTEESGEPKRILLILKISDPSDPLFVRLFECDAHAYTNLRAQQDLKVDFNAFSVKLGELLEKCRSEAHNGGPPLRIFQAWIHVVEEVQTLVILEPDEFKSLKHLTMELRTPGDAEVATHVTEMVKKLRLQLAHSMTTAMEYKDEKSVFQETMLSEKHEMHASLEALNAELTAAKEALFDAENRLKLTEKSLMESHEVTEAQEEKIGSLQALLASETERTRTQEDQLRELKVREAAAIQKASVLERLSNDGEKMTSQIVQLLETGVADRSKLEASNLELTAKQVQLEEKLAAAELSRSEMSKLYTDLEVKLSEQAELLANLSHYKRRCSILEQEVTDLKAQVRDGEKDKADLTEANELLSKQKRIIQNNHEVIKWLNQRLNNQEARATKETTS